MADRNDVSIHKDTAKAVDTVLRGFQPRCERRKLAVSGQVEVEEPQAEPVIQEEETHVFAAELPVYKGATRIYPHGVSRELLERVTRELGLDVRIGGRPEQADVIIALRSRAEDLGLKRLTRLSDASVHMVKRNTTSEIRRLPKGIQYRAGSRRRGNPGSGAGSGNGYSKG
jgi:hypothetical protein